jgi:hypothetical protein
VKYHCVTRWRAPVGNLSTIRENPFHNVTLFNKNVVTLCLGKGKHHFLKNYSKGSMATNTKNILALDTNEAFDFLMRSEHFLSFERPLYFDFDEVLGFVRKTVAGAYDARLCLIVMGEGLTLLNKPWPAPKLFVPFPQQTFVNKKLSPR